MRKHQKSQNKRFKYLIGIDEVGRGPVAGPVAVCASLIRYEETRNRSQTLRNIFKSKGNLPGLRDSKRLTAIGREVWFSAIKESDLHFELGYSSAKEIDKRGIAVCIKLIIQKNLMRLQEKINFDPQEVLILLDGGLKAPEHFLHQETIIKGDDKEPIISFASIYAKVSRDRLMVKFSNKYPQYGLDRHKGYGTKMHMEAVRRYGLSDLHRKTFLKKV